MEHLINTKKVLIIKESLIPEIENYTWLSSQLKYFSNDTASTAIGMNPWYTPQISEHCP